MAVIHQESAYSSLTSPQDKPEACSIRTSAALPISRSNSLVSVRMVHAFFSIVPAQGDKH